MLDGYIRLKEQKVMMDRERVFLEQEKNRVQMLLLGMQNVMNAYSASRSLPEPNVPAAPIVKPAVVPQPNSTILCPWLIDIGDHWMFLF